MRGVTLIGGNTHASMGGDIQVGWGLHPWGEHFWQLGGGKTKVSLLEPQGAETPLRAFFRAK